MDGAVGELDGNQREVTGILRENGIKLQRLIENLLSFSAWQTSSASLDSSEFRLRPLVKQVLENQQLTLLSQRVRLDVKIEDVTLVADRGKVRLILENLLSNAVKYSPKGGAIHMSANQVDDSLVLDVADNGPGIPDEDRAHIFEAFYTGRAAKGGSLKGTGIGLSVVLEFVNAHGGSVQIVDGEYPGAHFRITMPIRSAGPFPEPSPRTAREFLGRRKPRMPPEVLRLRFDAGRSGCDGRLWPIRVRQSDAHAGHAASCRTTSGGGSHGCVRRGRRGISRRHAEARAQRTGRTGRGGRGRTARVRACADPEPSVALRADSRDARAYRHRFAACPTVAA